MTISLVHLGSLKQSSEFELAPTVWVQLKSNIMCTICAVLQLVHHFVLCYYVVIDIFRRVRRINDWVTFFWVTSFVMWIMNASWKMQCHELDQKSFYFPHVRTKILYLSSRCIVQMPYTIVNWCSKNWPRIGLAKQFAKHFNENVIKFRLSMLNFRLDYSNSEGINIFNSMQTQK